MVEIRFRVICGIVWVLAGGLACASLDQSSSAPSGISRDRTEYRIAIGHVTLSAAAERARGENLELYADAATQIGHDLEEALSARGVTVVWAHNTRGMLSDLGRPQDFHQNAFQIATRFLDSLGVNALLAIEVTRWAPRGKFHWPPSPAEVGFRATLHGGPEGLLLWSGEFSERQQTFLENPWHALQYPGMGTRWLSVGELARWGARRLAAKIPIASEER